MKNEQITEELDYHLHDYGDADWLSIQNGTADCVDPECPDKSEENGDLKIDSNSYHT